MKHNLPLPEEMKLQVLYRVEPGCIGPNGIYEIESFCNFAQQQVSNLDSDYVHWHITPRFDKSLPEVQYSVNHRALSHDKADKYLQVFNKSLDSFEAHLGEKLAELVDKYIQQ